MAPSTLQDRLKLAMTGPPKVTQTALAKVCGISVQSVNDWKMGKTKKIEGSNLVAAARLLGVNPEWLASGKGPMRDESVKVPTASQRTRIDPAILARACKYMVRQAALHGTVFDPVRDADLLVEAYEIECDDALERPASNLLDFGEALRRRLDERVKNAKRGAG